MSTVACPSCGTNVQTTGPAAVACPGCTRPLFGPPPGVRAETRPTPAPPPRVAAPTVAAPGKSRPSPIEVEKPSRAPTQPVAPAPVTYQAPRPAKPPLRWEPNPKALRLGLSFVGIGIGVFVLPYFGLQWKPLARHPEQAATCGIAFLCFGATVTVLSFAPVRRFGLYVIGGTAALAIAGSLLLVGIGALASSGLTARFTPPPTFTSPSPIPSLPLGSPQPPPHWPAYESARSRFGAGHVVRVDIPHFDFRLLSTIIRRTEAAFPHGPGKFHVGMSQGDHYRLVFAPVDDLDAVASQLALGPAAIDRTERIVTITLDESKLPSLP